MRMIQRLGGRAAAVVLSLFVLQACAGTEDEVDGDSAEVRKAALSVDLKLDVAYAAHEPVLATVTITNVSQHPVRLLSWTLPAEDLEEPLFSVARAGASAEFIGPHYKRPPAQPSDFVQLAAGASLVRTVDLALFYDLTTTGDYKVTVTVNGARSNEAQTWIEGRALFQPERAPIDATAGLLSFTRCTGDQQSQATQAAGVANSMSDGALAYLSGSVPPSSSRFTTWFGVPLDGSRWTTARSHFAAIADAFDTKPVTIDCKCRKNYYAYVYPNNPYTIYVCRVFWQAPMSGTDSKGGTLIHEMSHFNVVASTDDWAYGQSACKSLAQSNPDRALDNADSHEYFAENTPALP